MNSSIWKVGRKVKMIYLHDFDGISKKTKGECGKKPKSSCYEISLENLGIRNLGNLIHDGCLKKKRIMLDIQDLFWKKEKTNI